MTVPPLPPRRPRQSVAVPAIAVGACAGYYLASVVGFQLRLPPATTSVLWPPNAVLTAALLLTPPRRWPIILLAVLPVHLVIQLQTEFPLAMILSLFVTNAMEAVVAAGLLYRLSDAPTRIDTLPRLAAFFVAVVIAAPLLSSFADAAAVNLFRGEDYWKVWRTRSLSNMLAELTVVPAVVGTIQLARRWPRDMSPARWAEAGFLAAGLVGIGVLGVRSELLQVRAFSVVSRQTPLALQLPFLVWAAMRFGPTGTGLALVATSVFSAWTVIRGLGPFASTSPTTTVAALTLSLIVVSSTLLSLATLLEERRQAQHALRVRLRFEELLSRLSAALVRLPGDQIAQAFDAWLGRIARVLGVDSLTVFSHNPGGLQAVYSWTDPEAGGPLAAVPVDQERWARRSLAAREPVIILSGSDDPDRGPASSPMLPGVVFPSGGVVPLLGEGDLIGALVFASLADPPSPTALVANAQLVGEVLASALRRKHSEEALRQSEIMKSAILQSLAGGVAVIDRRGVLLQVNDPWRTLAGRNQWMHTAVGGNLIAECWAAFEKGDRIAGEVVAGVTEVLERSQPRFTIEQRTEAAGPPEWWTLTAVPLNRPEGGAVLTRANVTDLRRAELDAQRSREELAHVSRLSTVGEMTASLAHQLNQPLAAIMTNAQAGRRILDSERPDFGEVRAILGDIVDDDRRASDVIQRVRELLRKGQLDMTRINLTAAIRDVADLVASEAIIRNATVSVEFEHEPLFVRGDRVQLQQVVLNLVQNAMDAMVEGNTSVRRIALHCARWKQKQVIITVRDSGPGLPPGTELSIFEPFYTTKKNGMGMGLSIVRSIIEAHGGMIEAANDPGGRGAVFEVVLPAAAGEP